MTTRTRFLALLALTAATLSMAVAIGDEASSLTAHANGAMAKYMAAFKRKDTKTCERILRANFAKDYKSTDLKGKVTGLDHMIEQENQHMAMLKKVNSAKLNLAGIKVNGNTATGKGTFIMDAVVVGDPHNPKATHKLHVEAKWDTKLKKVGNKWWIAEDKATSEKVLMDGKPMPPM